MTKRTSTVLDVSPDFKGSGTCVASVHRMGNIVTLHVHDIRPINASIPVSTAVLNIPIGYRPPYAMENGTSTTTSASNSIRAYLGTNGTLIFQGGKGGAVPLDSHSMSFTFFTNDI